MNPGRDDARVNASKPTGLTWPPPAAWAAAASDSMLLMKSDLMLPVNKGLMLLFAGMAPA